MRTATLFWTGLLAATAALTGCNDLLGIFDVETRGTGGSSGTTTSTGPGGSTTTSTGPGGSTSTGTAGSTGAAGSGSTSTGTGPGGSTGTGSGPLCEEIEVANNLIQNPSFETTGSWMALSGGDSEATVTFESVAAESCSIACGDRVGRLFGDMPATDASPTSFRLFQKISPKIETGGVFRLSAKYDSAASQSPYWGLYSNGYYIGDSHMHGDQVGDHFELVDVPLPVADPRRTGKSAELQLHVDTSMEDVEVLTDCVSLTYTPPANPDLLPNGWFDQNILYWQADSGANLVYTALNGLCTPSGGLVTVPANTSGLVLRSDEVTGSWPAGTKLRASGAVGPQNPGVLEQDYPPGFALVLHVIYEDDGIPASDDFAEQKINSSGDSEPWDFGLTTITTTRPATAFWVGIEMTTGANQVVFAADCFAARVVN